jgi:hypothetical protein
MAWISMHSARLRAPTHRVEGLDLLEHLLDLLLGEPLVRRQLG